MDRSSLARVALIAVALLLFWFYGLPLLQGKTDKPQAVPPEVYASAPDFVPDAIDDPPGQPTEGTLCKIKGNRFDAELSTRGAALVHFFLRDPQYAGTDGLDLGSVTVWTSAPGSTVPDHERWRSLRTLFRGDKGKDQLQYDRFNWKLDPSDGSSCRFTYDDADVSIVKTISVGQRPFELDVETTLTNLDDATKHHQFSIEAFAYRQTKDVKGGFMKRASPFVTELSCARGKDVTRKNKDDFKGGWFSEPLVDRYAAVSNSYFGQAIVPSASPAEVKPECDLLAEDWFTNEKDHGKGEDLAGAVYHARLLYPSVDLAPKESATYKQTAFFGPKERDVLAKAGGGQAGLSDLINLGFFSPVAKVLVGILVFFHAHVTFGSWGLAIIAMTLCLRVLLIPLSIKPVKTAIAMRRLKPEIDIVSAKFKDDAQAKNMAMMELYRKHGVNPLGGCLPQLVQMPIWFAMYTTLQTAVEMYHEKFLWFTDLSAPDRIFVLPLVLGAFMIVQQRIVPQQGMDPVQAKMMMYLLPLFFTAMMLFLPAALGVYMLTNSVLGITQQLVVEKIAPRGGGKATKGEIKVRPAAKDDDAPARNGAFGKGKASV